MFNSSDQSSEKSIVQNDKEPVPYICILNELKKVTKEEQARIKPVGFEFQKNQFLLNISGVLAQKPDKHARIGHSDPEKSIILLEALLKKKASDWSIDNPSFFKENSSELSVILNGVQRIAPNQSPKEVRSTLKGSLIGRPNLLAAQVENIIVSTTAGDFKRKINPNLVVKGSENDKIADLRFVRSKSREGSRVINDSELNRLYKISSRATNGFNDPLTLHKVASLKTHEEFDPMKILKRSVEGRLTEYEERRSPSKKLPANPTLSVRNKQPSIQEPSSSTKLLTTANLLSLVKNSSGSTSRIPTQNGLSGVASVQHQSQSTSSSLKFKSQILTKLMKKPSENSLHRDTVKLQSANHLTNLKRDVNSALRGSKIISKKSSKGASPEQKTERLFKDSLPRKSENGSVEHVRSASKNMSRNAMASSRGRERESEHGVVAIENSSQSRTKMKAGPRIYHAKNLSEFNITSRNLTKMHESARAKPAQSKASSKGSGSVPSSLILGLQCFEGQVFDEGIADREDKQASCCSRTSNSKTNHKAIITRFYYQKKSTTQR